MTSNAIIKQAIKRYLVEMLIDLEHDTLGRPTSGLCHEVSWELREHCGLDYDNKEGSIAIALNELAKAISTWPKYSGDSEYPIKVLGWGSPLKSQYQSCTPDKEAYALRSGYIANFMAYSALRIELAHHIINNLGD